MPYKDKTKAAEQAKRYRLANRDKNNAASRAWYHRNKEQHHLTVRRGDLNRLYGITPEQYAEMLEGQGFKCAICRTATPGGPKGARYFSVDHCHEQGHIRGLLCMSCNTSIGKLNHNPATLRAAADYLEAAQQCLSKKLGA
jgi:hypothetical protein